MDKQSFVNKVFSSVASKYDVMNDVMSFGLHRLWKKKLIDVLCPRENAVLLDIASGTGDIAKIFLRRNGKSKAILCDINEDMLKIAKERFIDGNLFSRARYVVCNAEKLPFEDNSVDYCTIAFGIRNVSDIPAALGEFHRVLKVGGKFACLEFSHVENDMMRNVYDLYSYNVIPALGKCVTGDRESYEYLVDSIRKFPRQEEFLGMINDARFECSSYINLNNGIVAIHYGHKA